MVGVSPKPTALSGNPAPAALPQAATATFGGLLKYLRRRAQLSQRELGLAVGYSEAQVSRLERNERLPDMAALAALYLPALHLEDDPAAAAQLLALAAAARGEALPPDSGASLPPLRPPASAMAPAGNLPNALTHFLGREREIAEVTQLLATSRAVTLTGTGGSGKTRLAFQVAAGLEPRYRDGVFAVELAALADPALVLQAVAQVFGLREAPDQSLLDTMLGYLQPRQVLLVLDNCEHLILACAQLVETLLRACPDLQVLATSREGLGISGEVTWPVPGLALPDAGTELTLERLAGFDALRLFRQRARSALPSFELSEHNRAAVAEICQRLEGIPLAIELAAARVRALAVEQIAERLDDRFRLLAGGSRTAPARQQTLSGAIDWSYDLLSEPERALLRRLAVFAGGWTLEAAEQVGAGTAAGRGDVLDLLAQLVAKSLVLSEQQPGQAARFRMLETIREYAAEKLAAAGEARAARNRHLGFYVAFAEKAGPGFRHHQQVEWMGRLDTEADNLRAALTWALEQADAEAALRMTGALCEYWWISDRQNMEGFQWLSAALRLPANQGALERSVWRARALMAAGWLGLHTESPTRRAWLEESLSIYRELGDRPGTAEALMRLLIDFQVSPQRAAEAIPCLEESMEIWVALGDPWGIGVCLQNTAGAFSVLGQRSKAMDYHRRSVPMLREAGDRFAMMTALIALAQYTWLGGEAAAARRLLEDHLAISNDLGNKGGARYALQNLFEISIAQGRYDQAREEALALQMSTGQRRERASAQVRLGPIDYWQGRLAEARAHFEAALKSFQELNDLNGLSWAPAWLGSVAYRAGDLQQAQAILEADLTMQYVDGSELFNALLSRGDVARARGDLAHAAEVYTRGLKLVLDQCGQPHLPEYLEAFAKLALAGERPTHAARLLAAADVLRTRIGTPVPPVEQADYGRALAQARAQLGPAAFEAAWDEGRALGWERAVDLAQTGK